MKNQRGQVLVEFALAIIVFFMFVFLMFAAAMWGAAAFFTQEIAHEVAREYAVTEDSSRAIELGKNNMGILATMFIQTDSLQISVTNEGTKSKSIVRSEPVIKKFITYQPTSMLYITKTSEATLEHYIRNPDGYMGRK